MLEAQNLFFIIIIILNSEYLKQLLMNLFREFEDEDKLQDCNKADFVFRMTYYIYNINHISMALKLASGSYDNTIKFWDPSTGSSNPAETIKLSSAPNRIQITEDKSKIVIGMNNCAKVYDLKRPDQHLRSYDSDFKGNVTSVGCFWKQEHVIYTGCEDGYLRLFDIRVRNCFRSFKHDKPINCTALHPTEGSILTGDELGIVKWWDLSNGKEMMKIEVDYSIRSITVSETLERMAIGDNEGLINCYGEHMSKTNQKIIKAHDDYILKIQLSPNNKFLATCSADKKIKLFKVNMDNGKFEISEHKTLKGHLKWVWDCQFSCDSAYLITCSTDMTIKLWDVEKGELVQTLKGHDKGVICLALNDIAEG